MNNKISYHSLYNRVFGSLAHNIEKDRSFFSSRRGFLGAAVATGLGGVAAFGNRVVADESAPESVSQKEFTASYPILQNVTETSASVSWALNTQATGWVEWGATPALGKVARNSEFGLNPLDSDFLSARITGLAPNTTYYYRTATCAFTYKSAYDKDVSEPQYSNIYSFKTCGSDADGVSFYIMNDTHNTPKTLQAHFKCADEMKSDFILWNGDMCDDYMEPGRAIKFIANATEGPFAAERPLVISLGNHDRRGSWARNLKKCVTTWEQDDSRFASLGYNCAFRRGPLAMVVLDTGEDKPDWHPAWSEMANYEPYRELQTAWLAKALERPEIKSAPYLVAACHIPLYSSNVNANPGNILDQFATIQWPCAQQWGPLFEKYGVQLAICAHLHAFSYAAPEASRPWAQVVGGGPNYEKNATKMSVRADAEKMTLTCAKLADNSPLGTWSFAPRF